MFYYFVFLLFCCFEILRGRIRPDARGGILKFFSRPKTILSAVPAFQSRQSRIGNRLDRNGSREKKFEKTLCPEKGFFGTF